MLAALASAALEIEKTVDLQGSVTGLSRRVVGLTDSSLTLMLRPPRTIKLNAHYCSAARRKIGMISERQSSESWNHSPRSSP